MLRALRSHRMTRQKLNEFLERVASMDDAELSTFRMRVSISDIKKDARNKLYDAIERRAHLLSTREAIIIEHEDVEEVENDEN